jgi:hypothetical protein
MVRAKLSNAPAMKVLSEVGLGVMASAPFSYQFNDGAIPTGGITRRLHRDAKLKISAPSTLLIRRNGAGISRLKPGGFGGRFTYNFTNNFAFDSEAAYFPENPSGAFGQTVALAGLRAGIRSERLGAFAKLRPGVISFGGAFFRVRNDGAQNYFAVDIGGVLEFYPSPRVIARFDIGDTIIPFGNNIINTGGLPSAIRLGTTHNLQGSIGVGFRF